MLIFDIVPLLGVGPVRLGMSRHEVHARLGAPESAHGARDCFLSGFFVDFDESGEVEFIEMATSAKFQARLDGQCLHSLPAKEALAFVGQRAGSGSSPPRPGRRHVFPRLQLSLWRSHIAEHPGDRDSQCFEAIGVARVGYFAAEA